MLYHDVAYRRPCSIRCLSVSRPNTMSDTPSTMLVESAIASSILTLQNGTHCSGNNLFEITLVNCNVPIVTANPSSCMSSLLPTPDSEVQFDVVFRRQRTRTSGEPKFKVVPSRFLNLSDDFEFAGWGSIFKIALSQDDLSHGHHALCNMRNQRVLGQFGASALAANDILGGVFYTIPSVFAISGV